MQDRDHTAFIFRVHQAKNKTSSPPQIKAKQCFETSAIICQPTVSNYPKELSRLQHDEVKVKWSFYRPIQALRFPEDGDTQISRQLVHAGGKVVSPTHQRNITGTHFCWRLSRPQGHRAVGRIMSMKNSNDIIGNRTRDLPACSSVPKPTVLLRARAALGGSSDLARIVFTTDLLLLLLLLLRCVYYCCCHRLFLPDISLGPTVIPTAQASSFRLQYFPYYLWCSYSCAS